MIYYIVHFLIIHKVIQVPMLLWLGTKHSDWRTQTQNTQYNQVISSDRGPSNVTITNYSVLTVSYFSKSG